MKLLSRKDTKVIKSFLQIHIPDFIYEYDDERYDLMECYEIGFTFAHDLLRGRKINPNASPWGDGESVIFESGFEDLLSNIRENNIDSDVDAFCRVFLEVLSVFKMYFE